MDPSLLRLVEAGDDGDEVAAIVRLGQPGAVPEGVRIVTRFGDIATVRLRRGAIPDVRASAEVASMKPPWLLVPEPTAVSGDPPGPSTRSDERRPGNESMTGRGVVLGVIDFGCDFAHPDFRRPDGKTRLLALWDQSARPASRASNRYGYGEIHGSEAIDRALETGDPYAALGYHPADSDPAQEGAHGTHVMSIAAGNGRGGGPVGVAPEADLVFVQHSSRFVRKGTHRLGDSVTLLEAVDFVARTAGERPWVINISMGSHGGQHDGSTLVEQGLDAALRAAPGRGMSQSAGNYYQQRCHTSGRLREGEERTFDWEIDAADVTANELEVWYSGRDVFVVELRSPSGDLAGRAALGERVSLVLGGREVGEMHHRQYEPNSLDNHIDVFLYPGAPAGGWRVTLFGQEVTDGIFHAWIERDAICQGCQSRFPPQNAVPSSTTGAIANGFRAISVGAYDPHSPGRGVAPFSSCGPTRDGRPKPDLVAPGVEILAARSAPYEGHDDASLLTRMSGTSMASPHVAGALALMFEAAPRPLRSEETHNLLTASAREAHASGETAVRFGSGYLDLDRAIEAARRVGDASPKAEGAALPGPEIEGHIEEGEPDVDGIVTEGMADMADEEVSLQENGSYLVDLADEAVAAARGSRPSGALLVEVLSRAENGGTSGRSSPGLAGVVEGAGEEDRNYGSESDRWRRQVTEKLTGMKLEGYAQASETYDSLLALFEAVRDEAVALDREAIKKDRARDPLQGAMSSPIPPFLFVTISEYFDVLTAMLVPIFEGMSRAYQVMLEAVIGDLETGKDPAALEPLKDALRKMKSVIMAEGKSRAGLAVEVTRSSFAERGSVHLDYFLQGLVVPTGLYIVPDGGSFRPEPAEPVRDRSLEIGFYDVDQKTGDERKLRLEVVYQRRVRQIRLLEELYGVNAAVIARLAGKTLRLHDNDDWREFLALKVEAAREQGASDEDALVAAVELLEGYLATFTIHTPYDVYDAGGDNYLTREFPRALTGQLLHDCGVYALRIVYILSLIRKRMKLRFSLLLLPNHVGLVITGPSPPTIVAHNTGIHTLGTEELAKHKERWLARHAREGLPGVPDDEQFLGELGCAYFITGPLAMPFRFVKVPEYEKDAKKKLWKFYKSGTAHELFGPAIKKRKSDGFQFNLRYLKVLGDYVSLHNDRLVPFWVLTARDTWEEAKGFLEILRSDVAAGRPVRAATVRFALLAYETSLDRQFWREVGSRLAELDEEKKEIHKLYVSLTGLRKKDVRYSHGPRVAVFGYDWQEQYGVHLGKVEAERASLAGPGEVDMRAFDLIPKVVPPFAVPGHRFYELPLIDY